MVVVKNWERYLVEHLKENDLDEIQEEWLDENGHLVLVGAAEEDCRERFWRRFGHCFLDEILEAFEVVPPVTDTDREVAE